MNPCNEHTTHCNSLQMPHKEQSRQSNRPVGGIIGISALLLTYGLKAIARRSVEWFSLWREQRFMIRKLQALSDHYLKDIGLERSEIVSMVKEVTEMNTKLGYRADRDNSERYWSRNDPDRIHSKPTISTEDKLR